MTEAIREATVEEYMNLARAGDEPGLNKFIDECFGTEGDRDQDKIKDFAKEVLPIIEEEMKEEIMKAHEVPNEAIPAEATEVAVEETTEVKKEAANDAQVEAANDEAVVEASEATDESK